SATSAESRLFSCVAMLKLVFSFWTSIASTVDETCVSVAKCWASMSHVGCNLIRWSLVTSIVLIVPGPWKCDGGSISKYPYFSSISVIVSPPDDAVNQIQQMNALIATTPVTRSFDFFHAPILHP